MSKYIAINGLEYDSVEGVCALAGGRDRCAFDNLPRDCVNVACAACDRPDGLDVVWRYGTHND